MEQPQHDAREKAPRGVVLRTMLGGQRPPPPAQQQVRQVPAAVERHAMVPAQARQQHPHPH